LARFTSECSQLCSISTSLSEEDRETVKLFVNNRWQMMHTDMHSAGFVLDPEYNFEAYSQQPMEKLCPDFVTL